MIVNGYEIKYGADLSGANLRGANLYGADLRRADLREANLREADLSGANLRGANLSGADLSGADLYGAKLSGADLSGADLYGANLCGADLYGANLRGADLREANLCGADLYGAELPAYMICPETGGFVAWKKVNTGVIKLYIPARAKRTSSLVGRKCRAEYVKVLLGNGTSSKHGEYKQGEIYHPDKYDDDIRVECSHGVHFFITKKEAEEYQI